MADGGIGGGVCTRSPGQQTAATPQRMGARRAVSAATGIATIATTTTTAAAQTQEARRQMARAAMPAQTATIGGAGGIIRRPLTVPVGARWSLLEVSIDTTGTTRATTTRATTARRPSNERRGERRLWPSARAPTLRWEPLANRSCSTRGLRRGAGDGSTAIIITARGRRRRRRWAVVEEESPEAARGGTGRGGIARRPTARPTSQRD